MDCDVCEERYCPQCIENYKENTENAMHLILPEDVEDYVICDECNQKCNWAKCNIKVFEKWLEWYDAQDESNKSDI